MRRYLSVVLVAGLVAIAFSFGLAATAWSTIRALERDARLQQVNRGRDVASQLEAYLRLSQQVANTTATLVSPMHDRGQTEALIQELLASTSADFVYGVGVWYEPYRFEAKTRYFGPYAHRSARGIVLTYEWSTPEYDYPTHEWYLLGRDADGHPAFTEPYFDVDYVYMTTARAIFDAQGRTVGVVSVDLILPQLQRLVAKANASPDEKVYVTTSRGRVFAHPDEQRLLAWARAKGRPADHLIDLTEPDLAAFEAERHAGAVETTVPIERAGWRVHVATARATLFAESDRVKGTAGVIGGLAWVVCSAAGFAYVRWRHARELTREVAERKRVETELRDGLRARDEFFAVVSHELRTPIAALSLRLQHLQRQLRRGRVVDESMISLALGQTRRLDLLITDMLEVAQIHAGQLALELSPTALAELVRVVIAGVAPLEAGRRLLVELPADEAVVLADSKRIEQVVSNLIDNAIKYSPQGGTIRVSLEHRAHDAVLCVRDEGIGIPLDQLPHVFERYFRGRNAPATSFGGLGLGLFISREIVVRHLGRVWVESTQGQGSAFFVSLPVIDPSSAPHTVEPGVH